MRLIKVAPLGEGWRVSLDGLANDMVFRSGGLAEAAARRLALRLARAGAPAEIRMHSSDQSLAGRFACPALPRPGRTSARPQFAQSEARVGRAA